MKRKRQPRKPSFVWEYYTKTTNGSATCGICHQETKHCNNTSNLKDHLTRRHSDVLAAKNMVINVERIDDSFSHDGRVIVATPSTSSISTHAITAGSKSVRSIPKVNKRQSMVWDYFTKTSNFSATCSLCEQELKHSNNTTNLKDHLERRHRSILEERTAGFDEENATNSQTDDERIDNALAHIIAQASNANNNLELSTNENTVSLRSQPRNTMKRKGRQNPSVVWDYFTKTSNSSANCTLCHQELRHSNNTTNLKNHLARRHGSVISSKVLVVDVESNNEVEDVSERIDDSQTVVETVDISLLEAIPHHESNTDGKAVVLYAGTPPKRKKSRGKKARQHSIVWDYFVKTSTNLATCNLCRQNLKHCNNTSNLKDHLNRRHGAVLEARNSGQDVKEVTETLSHDDNEYMYMYMVDPSQEESQSEAIIEAVPASSNTTLAIADKPVRSRLPDAFRNNLLVPLKKKKLDKCLVQMIAGDYQPLEIVEGVGFKAFVQQLDPRYNLPTKQTLIQSILPEQYNNVKKEVQVLLESTNFVAVGASIWNLITGQSYLTLTAHFIVKDRLFDFVLNSVPITNDQTAESIAIEVSTILQNWGLEEKVVVIVSDNDSNLKAAAEVLKINHMTCFGQMLNLVVDLAFDEVDGLNDFIKECRLLVSYFKSNTSAAEKLQEIQLEMGMADLELKQAITNRWTSILYMFERLLEVAEPLTATLSSLPKSTFSITTDTVQILKDCVTLLKPLELMALELGAEKTVSKIIPLVRGTQQVLREKAVTTSVGSSLKTALVREISAKLASYETQSTPAIATLIDPRFKRAAFGNDSNANGAVDQILLEVKGLLQLGEPDMEHSYYAQPEEPNECESLWTHFESNVANLKALRNSSSNSNVAVQRYMALGYENRRSDPIKFWAEHKSIFPELQQIAGKYLCIPATSIPSERLFTKSGQIILDKRSKLKAENVDMFVFLNHNLKERKKNF